MKSFFSGPIETMWVNSTFTETHMSFYLNPRTHFKMWTKTKAIAVNRLPKEHTQVREESMDDNPNFLKPQSDIQQSEMNFKLIETEIN